MYDKHIYSKHKDSEDMYSVHNKIENIRESLEACRDLWDVDFSKAGVATARKKYSEKLFKIMELRDKLITGMCVSF